MVAAARGRSKMGFSYMASFLLLRSCLHRLHGCWKGLYFAGFIFGYLVADFCEGDIFLTQKSEDE